jgi:hypothetical protein
MSYQKRKVLITVKTYPIPSQTYQETVCTAGVLEDGSFIRLYPVDFRYMPYFQRYRKYQWIEVDIKKHERDPRKESYRPKLDSICPIGNPLSTRGNWAERKKYVLAKGTKTLEQLNDLKSSDRTSLGIVKPKKIEDLIVEPDCSQWPPKQQAVFNQKRLFGPRQRPLEKIPFKFSYRFSCDDGTCTGHKMMIADWELGELYRNMRDKYHDSDQAAKKVRQKFLDEMCNCGKDTHFFVGTTLDYGAWIVLGVFWPKKTA